MVKFPFTEIKELGNERGERRFPFWKQTILTDSWCCSQIWPWEMLTLLYGIWAAFFPSFIVTLFIFRWIRHNGWKVLLLWNKDLPLLELEQTFSEVELDTQTTANWENVIWIHMFVDISGVLWHGTATNTLTDSLDRSLSGCFIIDGMWCNSALVTHDLAPFSHISMLSICSQNAILWFLNLIEVAVIYLF